MSRASQDGDGTAEDVPLRALRVRQSVDSANSSDLDNLISADDDVSDASWTDLPPIDGGRGAWTCLLGCWLVEAMIWGFPLAFGVFQRHYSDNELFKESGSIPTIGTLATGMSYLGMPFTNPIAMRWPQHRKKMCVAGWLLCLLALLGASFASQAWQLVLSQGFVYGVGWVVCYTPFLFVLNEWFVERRGLAYGILFGASGVSGLIIPMAVGWMLERFGFRIALRVYVVATVVVSGPGLLLIRPRSLPQQIVGEHEKRSVGIVQVVKRFARNPHFYLFAAAIFVQGLGFFIPNVFIPSYAEGLGLSSTSGSGLLALVSLSQVLGQLWQGWISDRVNIYVPTAFSALVPGLGALILWGPAKNMAYLVPFALIWGFFSASYSVLYTRMCTFLTDQQADSHPDDDSVAMLLYGLYSFERGVSNILEGPVSNRLLSRGSEGIDVTRYGLGRYASIIWFTVFCMLASSLAGIGWFWRPRPR
ncbi:hypothetical protein LTR36_005610 [Oleoguttula mirabilis]|uniref:MFS general substrate transporter n=1 Tax=Oleoguttula mirabilis TaxID=1507867 RepID=A0AAV9JDV3_9PEZI|nr:hypothetical protein LTR36_005610 [Oleoguttula mirabilis]